MLPKAEDRSRRRGSSKRPVFVPKNTKNKIDLPLANCQNRRLKSYTYNPLAMIKKFVFLTTLVTGAVLALANTSVAANNISFDAADNPGNNPDASVNGEGPATDDAWTTVSSFGNSGSLFGTGLSDGTFTNDNTWQIFTVTGQDSQIYSKHVLDSALTFSQSISLDFANSGIAGNGNPSQSGSVGISLKDSNNTTIADFHFIGGQGNYTYTDATHNSADTGHAFESQDLMRLTWTVGSGGSYVATLSDPGTNTVEATWSGTLGGLGLVSGIEVFNNNGGNSSDVFYDDLTVVPEPSTWVAGIMALAGCLYRRRRRRIS